MGGLAEEAGAPQDDSPVGDQFRPVLSGSLGRNGLDSAFRFDLVYPVYGATDDTCNRCRRSSGEHGWEGPTFGKTVAARFPRRSRAKGAGQNRRPVPRPFKTQDGTRPKCNEAAATGSPTLCTATPHTGPKSIRRLEPGAANTGAAVRVEAPGHFMGPAGGRPNCRHRRQYRARRIGTGRLYHSKNRAGSGGCHQGRRRVAARFQPEVRPVQPRAGQRRFGDWRGPILNRTAKPRAFSAAPF